MNPLSFVILLSVGATFAEVPADNEVQPVFDYKERKDSIGQSGSGSPEMAVETPQEDSLLVADTVSPSLSSNLYTLLKARRNQQLKLSADTTTKISPLTQDIIGQFFYDPATKSETGSKTAEKPAGDIRPTRARGTASFVDGDERHDRFKRCFTCGPGGDMGMGGGANPGKNMMDMSQQQQQQQFDNGNSNNVLMVGNILNDNGAFGGSAQSFASQQQGQVIIRQGGDQGAFLIGSGTQTIAGAMRTTMLNGFAYTLSSYTKIVNGVPTIGVVTIGPIQTFYQGKALQAGQNPYGVPNQGTYTLAGAMSTYLDTNGYTNTVSSYTRIVDGAATFGAVTLSGMQTRFNGQLLKSGQNGFGVPNQGTYTLPGGMATSVMNGQVVTMSTYTRIVDGVATYGTITMGSMQTYYQGKLLAPGENAFGVPNQGTFTLPGAIATSMINGYAMTLSTYTRIVDGVATYGTVTLGTMQTYYQGKILAQDENAYGVPNQGTYTLQGAMSTALDAAGYPMTISTYTKIVDGAATFGTVTLGSMQTYYNNRLLKAGENAYGVPNQGVFTLAGQVSQTNINGYDATVSTYTKVVDGTATFGTVTLGGMQTYYRGQLLQPGQNAYGVPNVGVYTIPGQMSMSVNRDGYPMTLSTFTKVVDGQATFATITLGSMQTYYNNKVLRPDENPYGVPNQGTYTLPGPATTLADVNGYPVTISSYTKIIDGRATFGAVTQGMQVTKYNGKILRYGENPFGVPNEGTFTLPGSMQTLRVNGQDQTMSTYTRIINGQATYGTVTIGQMQTFFIPNNNNANNQQSFSDQNLSAMQGAFVQNQNQNQNSFSGSSQGSQFNSNRVIDSGSQLIPSFIATAQQVNQPTSVVFVPSSNQGSSSSSRFSQSVMDTSNVQVIPVFSQASSGSPSSDSARFAQLVDQASNMGSFVSPSANMMPFSGSDNSGVSKDRFAQVVDQLSNQQNQGSFTSSVQVIDRSSSSGGQSFTGGGGQMDQRGGFIGSGSQMQQSGGGQASFMSGSQGSGSTANKFLQVLDQISPAMQGVTPNADGTVHKSFQIINRVSGTFPGPCGGKKKK